MFRSHTTERWNITAIEAAHVTRSTIPVWLVSTRKPDGTIDLHGEGLTNNTARELARILSDTGDDAEYHRLEIDKQDVIRAIDGRSMSMEFRGIVA